MMAGSTKITSYNCEGFKYRNFSYLNEIFNKCDILLLQETWLHSFQFNEITNILNNCHYHAVTAMNEADIGRVGRPFGGCAIVWHRNLAVTITPVVTTSPRICAVTINSDDINILLMSLYMPTDEDVNFIAYGDVLHEVSSIMTIYDNFDVILGGDLNVDYSRNMSRNLNLTKSFISQEDLICATLPISSNEYTRIDSRNNKSFIDHFLVSSNVDYFNVCVAHDGNNLSDHEPITFNVNYNVRKLKHKCKQTYVNNWDRATSQDIKEYQTNTDEILINFDLPDSVLNCNNMMCNDHNVIILQKLEEFINILILCGDKTIPMKVLSNKNKGGIPGWNEFVQPYKDKSIFWNNVWRNSGSPRVGQLADERRLARNRYHWAIRKVKQNKDKIVLEKTANSLARKSFGQFWRTIKDLNKSDNRIASVVDGKSNDGEIAKHFNDIYANLYSSVKDDDFENVTNVINNLVNNNCNKNKCTEEHCHNISTNTVRKAINSLSSGKDDETYYMYSDHFLNASDLVILKLSKLITAMIKHGTASLLVNKAVIKPIPKNKKKSLSDSNNYRAICKNTIVSKILDYVIIEQIGHKLTTSTYQFAYKSGFSTSLCSFLVAETIQYYRSRGSNVYMLSLDATKAFDRVQYSKLFKILVDRNICPLMIRFIVNIYCVSTAMVKWNSEEADAFPIFNGVKQGAVISAPLFAVYINPLLDNLQRCKKGCYIGNLCANAFAYAGDVVILSPICTGLRSLISICEKFYKEYKLKFNSDKCTLFKK